MIEGTPAPNWRTTIDSEMAAALSSPESVEGCRRAFADGFEVCALWVEPCLGLAWWSGHDEISLQVLPWSCRDVQGPEQAWTASAGRTRPFRRISVAPSADEVSSGSEPLHAAGPQPIPGWELASAEVMSVVSPALRSCAAVEFEDGALRSWQVGVAVDAGGVATEVTVVGEPDSRFAQCARTALVGRVLGGSGTVWHVPLPLLPSDP
jgi:hypothetical protein